MKIIKLKAENIKKIKAIEIEPKENTVIISGKNAAGKTSVLDSIWYALGGSKNIPQKPIRKGEKKAEVTLDLGDIIVTRKWTSDDKSYLQVTNKEGAVFPSPQKMLDKLIGDLSFNPLEFAQADKEKQIKILLDAVKFPEFHEQLEKISGIKIDKSEPINIAFNKAYKTVFDERTIINREIKNLKVKYDSIEIPENIQESEPINLHELYEKREQIKSAQHRYSEIIKRLNEIDALIKKLEMEKKELTEQIKTLDEFFEPLGNIDDYLEDIEQKIQNADKINKLQEKIRIKKEYEKELKEKEEVANELTERLEKIKSYKDEIIASSQMPIPGLNFANGEVTYNNIPFSQLSSSEQLKVSLAIAMALNPELRVIRITDGSLLDNDSMAIIREMADKKDYQVWIEVVDDSGKLGIYIEDGEIKND